LVKFAVNGAPHLKLGSVNELTEGQKVIVIGNPAGIWEWSVSDGIISALRADRDLIQITAPISHGSSGSPVLNEEGNVIGIASATYQGQNPNFAISTKAIQNAWRGGLASQPAPSRPSLEIPSRPPSPQESVPSGAIGPPVTEREKRAVSFVRQFVASGNSGSNLPSPDTYYAPQVIFEGKLVTREHIARLVGIASKIFPERSIQIVSGPFIDHSQPGPNIAVTYQVAGLFKNKMFGLQMKAAPRIVVRSEGGRLVIVSNTPNILEKRLVR
jgi:hypothetical protein